MKSRIPLAAAVAAAVAVAAPSAMAQSEDTVALEKGGATKLSLTSKAKAVLKDAGTTVSGRRFGITGGTIDPADGDPADVGHSGKLTFKAAGDRIVFKNLNVLRGASDKLTGKTGGKTVTIAKLSGGKVARQGVESTDVNGIRAKLTRAAARAINHALETGEFKKGLALGKLSVDAQLAEVLIASGQSFLDTDPAFAQKLFNQGISATAVAPATMETLLRFRFPVVGGRINTTTQFGVIEHSGGLLLQKGQVMVPLSEPFVEIDATPTLTVSFGPGVRQAAADVDVGALTRTPTANGVDLAGAVAKLTAGSALLLNGAFSTTVFMPGDVVGTLSSSVTFK